MIGTRILDEHPVVAVKQMGSQQVVTEHLPLLQQPLAICIPTADQQLSAGTLLLLTHWERGCVQNSILLHSILCKRMFLYIPQCNVCSTWLSSYGVMNVLKAISLLISLPKTFLHKTELKVKNNIISNIITGFHPKINEKRKKF